MSDAKIAIFGGTGQTGGAIAKSLRGRGFGALPLSRSDLADDQAAWRGADAAYLIAPNMYADEPSLIQRYLDLLVDARISRVVYHSVAAPYSPAMKHHLGKAVSEDLVRRSGLDWTVVEPSAYIQNFLPDQARSEIRVPFDVDVRFGMVDLLDVGEAAVAILTADEHVGATYELGGPEVVSIREVAAAASEVLGRTVSPVAESPQAWAARAASGMPADVRVMFVDMWNYYDRHGLPTGGLPLRALLNRPGNSFAQVLARGREDRPTGSG